MVSHQAKYITSVKSVSSKYISESVPATVAHLLVLTLSLSLSVGGRPAVHVEYSPPRAGTETRTEVKDTATYILDDEEER